MSKQDMIRRINDEIAKISIPPSSAELMPLIEAVRLMAQYLDEAPQDAPQKTVERNANAPEEPDYAGK